MYSFKYILEVLNYYKERLTGIYKSSCNKWKHDYYNNYENLYKRYMK